MENKTCGPIYCPTCGKMCIHLLHRKIYESSSGLGQIIWREGPTKLTVSDLDIVTFKSLKNNEILLRLIEQKQPRHKFERPQEQILRLLDAIIYHCCLCPEAKDLKLNTRSGVYILRGLIEAATSDREETILKGQQTIQRLRDGSESTFTSHEILFNFLDPEDSTRRHSGK